MSPTRVANMHAYPHARTRTGGDDRDYLIFTQFNGTLFSENWFGETDSESHIVTKGRFAYQELTRDYNFTTRSAYGFLRAPWNLNPNKYVTRYHSYCGEQRRNAAGLSYMNGAAIGKVGNEGLEY